MKPGKAARRFARIATAHGDFLNLVDPEDHRPMDTRLKAAYRIVEKAVARAFNMKPGDKTLKLHKAVLKSVPKRYRDKLAERLNALSGAETDYLCIREQAAYLVGREMGRRLGRSC